MGNVTVDGTQTFDFAEMEKSMRIYEENDIHDKQFACLRYMYSSDKAYTYPLVKEFRKKLTDIIADGNGNNDMMELVWDAYKLCARDYFDDFCIFLEKRRDVPKRFYLPRRKQLLPLVEALQELETGDLELLTISMPPGTGKTTLAIFYLCWLGGRSPELSMLTGSHSNSFLHGIYEEILRIVNPNDPEYAWNEVFPEVPLAGTNAKDMMIDLGKRKRFSNYEFGSVGSGMAGKLRASKLLYCDDLVSGIEMAMNKEQLDKLWQSYHTDYRQRKIGDCKELHIATRWSVHDVIGRLEQQYSDNGKSRFITCPAVDEDGNSNFDYPYGVGFTTQFYQEQMEIMDDVSWKALYMNEPIEREGLLYLKEELRRYFELPDKEPDAIIAVCDTKTTGADYCVQPIAYQYGNDYFIESCIYDNSNPEVVEARLVADLCKHKVQMARYESNSAGGKIAEKVQGLIKQKGGRCKITTKYTTANKETKIIVNSPFVKEHFIFKDDSVIKNNKEYRDMLNALCSYTMAGKNKHDDVPDAMAMLAEYINNFGGNVVKIMNRPF